MIDKKEEHIKEKCHCMSFKISTTEIFLFIILLIVMFFYDRLKKDYKDFQHNCVTIYQEKEHLESQLNYLTGE